MKPSAILSLGQHVKTISPSHFGEGGHTRSEDLDAFPIISFQESIPQLPQGLSRRLSFLLTVSCQSEIDEPRKGGVVQSFPKADLLLIKALEIMLHGPQNAVMIRVKGLNDDLSTCFSASRPSSDLGEQLERSFARSKIREMERCICRDDSHKGDIWEIMAFDDHLCSYQDVDLPRFEFLQDLLVSTFVRGRVTVHSLDLHAGEESSNLCFEALRTYPYTTKAVAATSGTISRRRNSVFAIVTLERAGSEMVSEGHTAVGALKSEAAIRAEDEVGKPPSIEKEKALFFVLDVPLKRLPEPLGKQPLSLLDIHHLYLWKKSPLHSLRETQQGESPFFRVVE